MHEPVVFGLVGIKPEQVLQAKLLRDLLKSPFEPGDFAGEDPPR
jgi:hypothetical protein